MMKLTANRIAKKEKKIRDAWVNKLGYATLINLVRLFHDFTSNGETKAAMLAFWGFPYKCLICETKLEWKTEANINNDVDSWFCSSCCPICNSIR